MRIQRTQEQVIRRQMRVLHSAGSLDVELKSIRDRLRPFGFFVTRYERDGIEDGTFNVWDLNKPEWERFNAATISRVESIAAHHEAQARRRALREERTPGLM
jgi:hypothetical protein